MTKKTEEAIKIAEQIIEDILHKNVSSLTILRQYYSLVTLLNKDDEVEWALNELNGYRSLILKVPNYRKVTDSEDRSRFAVILDGCGKIEYKMRSGSNYRYQWNKKNPNKYIDILDYCSVGDFNFHHILNTLTNYIYTKTNQILLEIKFGKFEFDIFEETRKVVDTELNKRCPTAFEKLTEAYEDSMKGETPLGFMQTAHACRVVLKDFADVVYPANDKKTFIDLDGKSHSIKDNEYINRIIAYIQENADSKSDKKFIKHSLMYLGDFLYNINDLASKGTHSEISKEDANRCLIYTYLVLGDVIKLVGKN